MLPNSTDKFKGMIVSVKKMKNCHATWDRKQRLVVKNHKKVKKDVTSSGTKTSIISKKKKHLFNVKQD